MTYSPLRDLILVKKIEEKETASGIALPDKRRAQFIRVQIIKWGPDVKIPMVKGDIFHTEAMYQPLDKEQGLILEQYLFAKEEKE